MWFKRDMSKRKEKPVVSPLRHEAQCTICAHPRRDEIDREFVNWASAAKVTKAYKVPRTSLYRHAHATGLFPKRQKNVRMALEKIIEQAGEVEVNAAAVVSAVQAYAIVPCTRGLAPGPVSTEDRLSGIRAGFSKN